MDVVDDTMLNGSGSMVYLSWSWMIVKDLPV